MGRRRSFTEAAAGGPMDVADVPTTAPTRVSVDTCVARPDNPRPAHLDVAELAASIRESGQVQPATVASREAYLAHRPDHADAVGNASWVVLAGNRRLAACREAQVAELLVHVADESVANVIEVGVIENIQREPLTPVREAYELQQLHDRYRTTRAVGDRIGKSHVYVSQRLSLLELVPQLQAAVDEGTLKVSDARELAKIAQPEQMSAYDAGPPYRPGASKKNADRSPATGAVPGDPTTYTRTDLDAGNTVTKRSETTPPNSEGSTVGNTVTNGHTDSAPVVTGESTSGDALSSGSAQVPQPSSPFSSVLERTLPQDPVDLVTAIEREYTADQREELLKLLQQ